MTEPFGHISLKSYLVVTLYLIAMTQETNQETKPTHTIKRLRIVVTQEEIDNAKLAKSDGCMIQAAIKRDHPEFQKIWVDKNQIRFTDPVANVIYTFQMVPRGRGAILRWDAGETILPFDLWVRDPIVRERVAGKDGIMRAKKNEQDSRRHLGPVPVQRTKAVRVLTGRDRVFGRKTWSEELAKLRADLGVVQPPVTQD